MAFIERERSRGSRCNTNRARQFLPRTRHAPASETLGFFRNALGTPAEEPGELSTTVEKFPALIHRKPVLGSAHTTHLTR